MTTHDNDTFAEDRRAGIGGSDLSKLMIPNYRYGGPYDLYLDKVEGSTFVGNNATRRGHYMEPCVGQWYADTTGRQLRHVSPTTDPDLNLAKVGEEWTMVHPVFPWLRGTPDYLTDLPDLGFEAKTARERQLGDVDEDGNPLWGPDGSDLVPLPYMIQCQWYMGLSGRRRWDLACFFVGDKDEFRCYHLEADPDFFTQMVAEAVAFWQDHIEPRVPPPVDLIPSGKVLSHLLTKAFGKGLEVKATPRLNELAQDWAALQSQRLNSEDDESEVKGEFAQIMGELGAAKVKGTTPGGKNWSVAAREGKTGTSTNHKAVSAILQRLVLDRGAATEEEVQGILADNTIPTSTDAYIQGYFNSINKDRKALRAAMKASPSEGLSA